MAKRRSAGEGSIYQRHHEGCTKPVNARGDSTCKCPWQGVLVTGWHDKKPIRRKVTGTSRAAAAAKLRDLRDKAAHGQLPHGRIPTVAEWLDYWMVQIVAHKNRPSTVRTYQTHVDHYLKPLIGDHRLDRLEPEHIEAAYRQLRTTGRPGAKKPKPLSETTLHNTHVVLARSLKVALQRGKVVRNAATLTDAPQPKVREVEILSTDDARAVIEAARDQRNSARWNVALALGLRQGEALGLRWSDIDLEAGELTVRHSLGRVKGQGLVLGPTKSGRIRAIALPGPLLTELKAHRKAQNQERLAAGSWWRDLDYVFAREDGRPYDAKDDWQRWKALLAAAKVPDVKLHSARHTAATMLLALGVPQRVVQEILGHTQSKTTEGYQKRVNELHVDAAERMAGALWD